MTANTATNYLFINSLNDIINCYVCTLWCKTIVPPLGFSDCMSKGHFVCLRFGRRRYDGDFSSNRGTLHIKQVWSYLQTNKHQLYRKTLVVPPFWAFVVGFVNLRGKNWDVNLLSGGYTKHQNLTKFEATDDFWCADLCVFVVSNPDFSFLAFISDPGHLWRRKMSKMKNQDLKQQKRTNRHHKRMKNRPSPRISSNFGVLYTLNLHPVNLYLKAKRACHSPYKNRI